MLALRSSKSTLPIFFTLFKYTNENNPNSDDDTTFHRTLASEYISYAKPQPGESLLDLACGTGLVTYVHTPSTLPHHNPLPPL